MDTPGFQQRNLKLWERFVLAYNIDHQKYQKKGPWMYLGYFMIVSYFTILPQFFVSLLPFLHEHIPTNLISAFVMIVLNLVITTVYNLAMCFIYTVKHPFFEQFRVNKAPWMWETDYDAWIKLLKKSFYYFVINNIIINVPLSLVDAANNKYLTSVEEVPNAITILWQFSLFLLVEDFFYYCLHRSLHHPKLYWIHKAHHEYTYPISFAAQSSHPLEAVSLTALPMLMGFKILSYFTGVHVVSIWVFFTFRVIEGFDSYSGYEWGWAQPELLPFSTGSAFHSFHHSHNVGNFGSFFKFWDTLFGTNFEYIKYRVKQQQANQKNDAISQKLKKG